MDKEQWYIFQSTIYSRQQGLFIITFAVVLGAIIIFTLPLSESFKLFVQGDIGVRFGINMINKHLR